MEEICATPPPTSWGEGIGTYFLQVGNFSISHFSFFPLQYLALYISLLVFYYFFSPSSYIIFSLLHSLIVYTLSNQGAFCGWNQWGKQCDGRLSLPLAAKRPHLRLRGLGERLSFPSGSPKVFQCIWGKKLSVWQWWFLIICYLKTWNKGHKLTITLKK